MYYVYCVITVDHKLYIGSTRDLRRRMDEHNSGKSKYLIGKLPVKLDFYISVKTEEKARELEKYFKTGSGRAFLRKRILSDEVFSVV